MSAGHILKLARGLGFRIVTAESCTGGLLAAALTEIAGSSDVFERGFVTYSNQAKHDMLGVKSATLDRYGAVSTQVAQEMAQGALVRSNGDIAISITGIAGHGGSDHKPEGRVCFALAQNGHDFHVQTIEFGAVGRGHVRQRAVVHALEMLKATLSDR